MYNFPEITSFSEITVLPVKTLILMDIDDTILRYNKPFSHFYEKSREILEEIHKENQGDILVQEIQKDAYDLYNYYKMYDYKDIQHTDKEGFDELLSKLTSESGMCYLTARTSSTESISRLQLEHLGINDVERDIYFTDNKMTKGQFIEQYMDLSEFTDIICIDDNPMQLWSIYARFPNIRCYKFVEKEETILMEESLTF